MEHEDPRSKQFLLRKLVRRVLNEEKLRGEELMYDEIELRQDWPIRNLLTLSNNIIWTTAELKYTRLSVGERP